MDVSLLAISIGNTRTRLGAFVQGKLVERAAVATPDGPGLAAALKSVDAPLRGQPGAAVLIGSVDPGATDRVAASVRSALNIEPKRVDRDVKIPIGRQLDRESIIGEDRLLNAAAAYDTLKQACVVVDAGTAITVDFIDGAGTVHGGAIAPGARMMLASLHRETAQLPEVELTRPEEAIGHNTAEAMRSGVLYGLRGLVRELTEQYAEAAGAYPMVVATGGDAELLFEGYDLVERIVPDLALLGLAVTLQSASSADTD
jgi:type III pantothenate kinase